MLKWNRVSLVKRILAGIIVGVILALIVPGATGISCSALYSYPH